MTNTQLANLLADYLQIKRFKDYTVNGLQVAGRSDVHRILTAVTASQAAIDAAIAAKADALIVHHGYFWRGEAPEVLGIKRERLKALLTHDINLFAYHLPLDQHPDLGNNVLFGQLFSPLKVWQSNDEPMVWHAMIKPQPLQTVVSTIEGAMQQKAKVITTAATTLIEHIAWCSGAAQDFLSQASTEGAQLFITGEYAERSYHEAHELGCHFIACGHHASERAGIRALGEYLQQQQGLEVRFFDENNPF